MLVTEQLRLGDDSFVRYYKKKGDSNEHTSEDDDSPLTKDDFLLVLQSAAQSRTLEANPRILCVDGTHGLTGYKFFLLNNGHQRSRERFCSRVGACKS